MIQEGFATGVVVDGSSTIITISGEADLCAELALKGVLDDPRVIAATRIVVNLSQVTWFDQRHFLLGLKAQNVNREVAIVLPRGNEARQVLDRQMEICQINHRFLLCNTLEQALGA